MTPHIYIDKEGVIRLAELPEKPTINQKSEEGMFQWLKYDAAQEKALSEALYFEDQQQVKTILWNEGIILTNTPKHGIYPIPPNFPKVVEVTKEVRIHFKNGVKNIVGNEAIDLEIGEYLDFETMTFLRFVDEKQEITRIQDDPDFKRGVEKAKQEELPEQPEGESKKDIELLRSIAWRLEHEQGKHLTASRLEKIADDLEATNKLFDRKPMSYEEYRERGRELFGSQPTPATQESEESQEELWEEVKAILMIAQTRQGNPLTSQELGDLMRGFTIKRN
jgi:hypothetical protein